HPRCPCPGTIRSPGPRITDYVIHGKPSQLTGSGKLFPGTAYSAVEPSGSCVGCDYAREHRSLPLIRKRFGAMDSGPPTLTGSCPSGLPDVPGQPDRWRWWNGPIAGQRGTGLMSSSVRSDAWKRPNFMTLPGWRETAPS